MRVWTAVLCLGCWSALAQQPPAPPPQTETAPAQETSPTADARRLELNLLGKTNAAAGESRRNENIQFNLVDNNALKEMNTRLGATTTIVKEFRPERGCFSAEFGNPPSPVLHISPFSRRVSRRGLGDAPEQRLQRPVVFPGRRRRTRPRKRLRLPGGRPPVAQPRALSGSRPEEIARQREWQRARAEARRTHAARHRPGHPSNRRPVPGGLSGGASEPHRHQSTHVEHQFAADIDQDNAGSRVDQRLGARDRLSWRYLFTTQRVLAFELVSGQNPNADTRAHTARLTWERQWEAGTVMDVSAGFDRLGTLLTPEKNAVGPMVSTSGLETLGPQAGIQPVQHPAIRRPWRRTVVPEFRPDHQHAERRQDVSLNSAIRVVSPESGAGDSPAPPESCIKVAETLL